MQKIFYTYAMQPAMPYDTLAEPSVDYGGNGKKLCVYTDLKEACAACSGASTTLMLAAWGAHK